MTEPSGLPNSSPLELVDMKMQDVKLRCHVAQLFEHDHVVGDGVAHGRIEPQRLFAEGHQPRRAYGVSAGKQGDLVALRNQFLGEVGHDALGAAVKPRRHTLH